jgi:glutamate/tyrosine decarboxylase-like PLP-dependent enzyme
MSKIEDLLQNTVARSTRYRTEINERRVAPSREAIEALERFHEPLPESGTDDADVLSMLDDLCSPATMGMAGPRFFGFVIGGSYPVSVASNWLSTAWDQNVSMHDITPGVSTLEQVAKEWMKELLGLPEATEAAFVTGATVANFSSLAAARNRVYADIDWNVEANGLFGAPPVTVVIGDEAHPTLLKSLGMLGFGRDRVTRVPVDGQGRMIAAELPSIKGPTIVCTQAGNVNTGAFDPVGEICDRVRADGAWVHVDGAFGLWAAASPELCHQAEGLAKADSWATDAHKWLNVPYDCGVAFVRDGATLRAAMSVSAEYLMTESGCREPSAYTPELSRRARGVDVWAVLKSLGREGVAALVNRCCKHARHFATGLREAGFEILNEVNLNQVLVTFGDDATTRKVVDAIQVDGTCWCGVTVWQGRTAMRISVSAWSTSSADVDQSLDAIIRIARHVKS